MKTPARLLALALALSPLSSSALVIRNYNPATHDRIDGFPGNPSKNNAFLFAAFDFSGVGWSRSDSRKQLTLISPLHFVGANHFRPSVGSQIRFLNRAGVVREFTVASTEAVPNSSGQATDLFVGRLTAPVTAADQISVVPVHNLISEAAYSSLPLIVTGQTGRTGRGTIGAFDDFGEGPITGGAGINRTRTYTFTYNTLAGGSADAHAENGDSGSPTFVEHDGALALVGTHTAVVSALGTVTTYDTFVPHYFDALDAILDDEGYNVVRSNPTNTTLDAIATFSAEPLPAGTASTVSASVSNTGGGTARNLSLTLSLPAGTTIGSVSAGGWSVSVSGTTLTARRGSLATSTSSGVTLTIIPTSNPTAPLTASGSLGWDTAPSPVPFDHTADIFVPYSVYAAGLQASSPGDDNDHDGADNAAEYAAGTRSDDPSSLPGASISLADDSLTFTRRTTGHTTTGEVSDDLKSWSSIFENSGSGTPTSYGFERVTLLFSTAPPRNFVRLRTVIP